MRRALLAVQAFRLALRAALAVVVLLLAAGCGEDTAPDEPPSMADSIAFASSRDGDFEIYTMRPDGTGVRQLTENEETGEAERRDEAPKWSRDGRRIAFLSGRDHGRGGVETYEVYVMRADGSDERRLTENEVADLLVGWTEEGEIVFWQCEEGVAGCELRLIRPDGGDERAVYETRDAVVASGGVRNGEVLATIVDREAESFEDARVFAIDLETGERRPSDDEGLLSPDGKRRLISTDRDKNGACLFHDCTGHAEELYVNDRRLTNTVALEADPRWSPGGKRILFTRIENDDGDDFELWVMNADGSCQTQLTNNGEWDWTPDWYGRPQDDRPIDC